MPTIHEIRESIYCDEENVVVLPKGWHSEGASYSDDLEQIFNLQESQLLLTGVDKIDRLQQLHQQVIVLRGAALNGILLSVLCAFGLCADWRKRLQRSRWRRLTFLPMLVVFTVGLVALGFHIAGHWGHNLSQPPIVESALILLGLVGPLVVSRQEQPRFYFNGCLIGLTIFAIAYGGWWWTEVMYDQLVLHSFYMLPPGS